MSRVSLPSVGIMTCNKIPPFNDLTILGFKAEAQPQKPQIRKEWLLHPLSLCGNIIVDLRINETRQTGGVRKTKRPFYRLVGTVSNPDRLQIVVVRLYRGFIGYCDGGTAPVTIVGGAACPAWTINHRTTTL